MLVACLGMVLTYTTFMMRTKLTKLYILIDFLLSVKVAILIFISGSGVVGLFHLLRKGNQVLFIIW